MAAAPHPPARQLTGIWGGDRATLTLTASGGSFIEDCATSTIGAAVQIDAVGRFAASGTHIAEGPGPTFVNESVVERPVAIVFAGHLEGETMALDVRVSGGAPIRYYLRAGPGPKRIALL